MLILSSISSALKFWSVNHNVFKNIDFLDEISNNWLNDLLGTNTRLLNLADSCCWQYFNGSLLLLQY